MKSVTHAAPEGRSAAPSAAALLCLITMAAALATAPIAQADGPGDPSTSVASPTSPPLAQLVLPASALGGNYRVATTWDGGEIVYAVHAVPQDGIGGPAVLQEVQRLPTSAAAESFFREVVADPATAAAAFDVPSPGPPGSRAIKLREVGDSSETDVIVLLARQGPYVVRVELQGEDGTSRAPDIAVAGRLLDGLLARLPAEPLGPIRLLA